MEFTLGVVLLLFLSGCAVGTMGAFLGIGGGIVIIPLLTVLFKLPIHQAIATSLAIVVANSIATSRRNLLSGMANAKLALIVALFSVGGSVLGGKVSMSLPGSFLYITLGVSQLLTAVLMMNKKRLPIMFTKESKHYFSDTYYDLGEHHTYYVYNIIPVGIVAILSGALSGMVGVGGGVMIVPAMNLIGGVPIKIATATSALIMGFTAAGGGLQFFANGYTNVELVSIMVPAIFLSTYVASKAVAKVSSEKIYKAFVWFLILVAFQMLYKGITLLLA